MSDLANQIKEGGALLLTRVELEFQRDSSVVTVEEREVRFDRCFMI